jgi:hypothetical protein
MNPILTRQLFEAVQAKRVLAQDAHRMSAKESADSVDSRAYAGSRRAPCEPLSVRYRTGASQSQRDGEDRPVS